MSSIEAALAVVESQELGEKMCYTKAAQQYGVDCSTLSRRHCGQTTSRIPVASAEERRNLHLQQEQQLLPYIK
jgi:hypothetical protein